MIPGGRTRGIAALAGSVLLSAAGQLGMKAGMQALHHALAAPNGPKLLDLWSPLAWTTSGLACYGGSLALWLVVLMRYPLSKAYPLLSLSYVCVYAGAVFWPRLAETASPLRTFGTLLILVGVAFVSFSRARPAERRRAVSVTYPPSPSADS